MEYGPDGYPILPNPRAASARGKSAFAYFVDECRFNCLTDMAEIKRLWPGEQARRKAKAAAAVARAKARQIEIRQQERQREIEKRQARGKA